MRQDDLLEQIKERLTLSEFIGRSVQLKKRGHSFVGCCPFHQEKTPSFTINDQKGFYHCFGCEAHGSIFDFLMFQHNIGFPEAVQKAADLAGISLPKALDKKKKDSSEETLILNVLEESCQYFQGQLALSDGTQAREYLKKHRKLEDQTIKDFRLGYAPSFGLKDYLIKKGHSMSSIQRAGLLNPHQENIYEKFRHRVMFPISDREGRVIGFGGRLLVDGEPKYLNSPETLVFHKGKTLFNLQKAWYSKQKKQPLFVVEGYLDVLQLGQFGYERVVAPMGTALTEDQIHILWKISPEPIVCFDGDSAGQLAAYRTIEKVLPILKAGHSLSFMMMSQGEDPDTLLRKQGKSGWEKLTASVVPLSDFLWHSLVKDFLRHTPEQIALLEKKIADSLSAISDSSVRVFYQDDLKNKFFIWRREKQFKKKLSKTQNPYVQAKVDGKKLQENIIMASILEHPKLLDHVHEVFSSISYKDASLLSLQDKILFYFHDVNVLEKIPLHAYLKNQGLETNLDKVYGFDLKVHAPFIWEDDFLTVLEAWKNTAMLYQSKQEENTNLSEAKETLLQEFSLQTWERFKKIKEAISSVQEEEKEELL